MFSNFFPSLEPKVYFSSTFLTSSVFFFLLLDILFSYLLTIYQAQGLKVQFSTEKCKQNKSSLVINRADSVSVLVGEGNNLLYNIS